MEWWLAIIVGAVTGIMVGVPTAYLLAWWLEHEGYRWRK